MVLTSKFGLQQKIRENQFFEENRFLLSEISHSPKNLAPAIIFPAISALLEGLTVIALAGFLSILIGESSIETNIAWIDKIFAASETNESTKIYGISICLMLLSWLRSVFKYYALIATDNLRIRTVQRIRTSFFEQLQSLSLNYFTQTKSGTIVNVLTTELSQLQLAIRHFNSILNYAPIIIAYLVIMARISWQLSLISFGCISIVGFILSKFNAWVRAASFHVSQANSDFTSLAIELVGGIRTMQAFSTQSFERKRFYKASSAIAETTRVNTQRTAAIRPITEILGISILIGILLLGFSIFIPTTSLQKSTLLTFIFVLFRLVPLLSDVSRNFAFINSYQGSIRSIEDFLSRQGKSYLRNGSVPFSDLDKSIEFNAAAFGYDANNEVLKNISISIKKGKTVAFVGASGAGKSTLVDLIPRFYDVTQGEIIIDGVNIKEYDVASLRNRIAIVSQDTFIFNASVQDNIAYGLSGVDFAEIKKVSQLSNSLEFIQGLPDGFSTQLGERGVRLSGGQRQRIAIARALLRNPDILILDEATSALDSVSEHLIQESIKNLSMGRTVIAIAHRLSTIANADKVIVLNDGRVVEQGTYEELIKQRGSLWQYHQIQYEQR